MAGPEPAPAVLIEDLVFAWRPTDPPTLNLPRLAVMPGEQLLIQGPSGSGKSTLLSLLAGVTKPQAGRMQVLGQNMADLSGPQRDRFRAQHIGYVFQQFNLLPYLSVLENVLLPGRFSPLRRRQARQRSGSLEQEARRLLTDLDLADPVLLRQSAASLSVGQQQRVAVARALLGAPGLLIADEPTSALDPDRREAFLRLLFTECAQTRATLVFVSHDPGLAPLFDRQLALPAINRIGN